MNHFSSSSFKDTKSHYEILDGLRGVAAVLVVMFHIMETFTMGDNVKQVINHGYLAVDFFFVLSGFVIGYAYDDRWGSKMDLKGFFKRRLIRLHPMIIAGMLFGALLFYFQDGAFPGLSETPVWKMLLVMVIGFTLLPVPLSMDIRGWHEMHPLNGPAWSLFFEYIANILYGLFVRKFSKTLLTILVVISGAALAHLAITRGDVIGGWSIEPLQLRIGLTRLMYPFFAGLLLSRIVKPGSIKNAFLWSSLLLILVFSVPRIGGHEHIWMNGIYVSLSILLIFPVIVYLGASGEIKGKFSSKLCKFLGDVSYPLYIIHYPIIYWYTSWVYTHQDFIKDTNAHGPIVLVLVSLFVMASSLTVAYTALKFYDEPVRKWLSKKFMTRSDKKLP
jgi:peptidoglycan/LPS O-acetylase OafA/YrhL